MNATKTALAIANLSVALGLLLAGWGVLPEPLFAEPILRALYLAPPEGPFDGFARLGFVVGGGLFVGFAVAMRQLVRLDAPTRQSVAEALLTGVAAWFVVDSLGSVLVGAVFNVVGNLLFLFALGLPLLSLRNAANLAPQPSR